MQLTLDLLQSILTDLTSFIHLTLILVAVVVLLITARALQLHHDSSYFSAALDLLRTGYRYVGVKQLHYLLQPQVYVNCGVAVAELTSDYGMALLPLMQALYANLSLSKLHNNLWLPFSSDTDYPPYYGDVDETEDAGVCLRGQPAATLVSGLTNTGNSCYLNSVLQALSSLPRLQVYLDRVQHHESAKVSRSLMRTLRRLTKPVHGRSAFRPTDIVSAMASANKRFANQDQEDAQEFFQMISSSLETEYEAHEKAERQQQQQQSLMGLKDLLEPEAKARIVRSTTTDRLESPFTGLLASRLSCMQCAYTGAIRHFPFNNVQLTLPDTFSTSLEACLQEYVALEYLSDAACRKCALIEAASELASQLDGLKEHTRNAKDLDERRQVITKVVELERRRRVLEDRLNTGQIEEEDDQLRTVSRLSSKQAMIAKPPKTLCLHLSRSTYHPSGAVLKNTCHVSFPEELNLAPYCTDGTINMQPHLPMSSGALDTSQTRYRLMSVIVHFGSHDFGHFIAYKRRVAVESCSCAACGDRQPCLKPQDTWYRISDDHVSECTLEEVLQSDAYMLLYEQVADDLPYPVPVQVTPEFCTEDQSSIEALRIANTLLSDDRRKSTSSITPPTENMIPASSSSSSSSTPHPHLLQAAEKSLHHRHPSTPHAPTGRRRSVDVS